VRAALAARRGDRFRQRAALAAAIAGFERVEMALHAAGSRLQVAAVEGDATAWAAAENRLRAEDVRDPVARLRTARAAAAGARPRTRGPKPDSKSRIRATCASVVSQKLTDEVQSASVSCYEEVADADGTADGDTAGYRRGARGAGAMVPAPEDRPSARATRA